MIEPSIGRVVWYTPAATERIKSDPDDQCLPALVTYVWNTRMINLAAFTPSGVPFGVTSVILVQEGDATPIERYATWMPYQIGQAKKNG
jgi:hypothetical protein